MWCVVFVLLSPVSSLMADLTTRILIIGPSNIGDAILISDVIAAVHAQAPQAHLTLLVGARAKAVFAGDPRIQTLVDVSAYETLAGRWKLALALWRYRPQCVIDLRHTAYPIFLKPWQAWRYLRQPPSTIRHMRQRHLWKLGFQVPRLVRSDSPGKRLADSPVWLSEKDLAHAEELWQRWRLDSAHGVVILCPGARSHIKRWTAEGFARVADRLILDQHVQVIVSGEPEEQAVVDEIIGLMRLPVHRAVGLTTIRQLGALMRRARLVITNDSASLHVASAFNIPTVAIFGPTDSDKYGPTAARHRVIRRRLFCTPCEVALCRFHHECMRFISADEVYAAAKALLTAQQ